MLNTNEKTSIKQYSKCLKIVKCVLLGFIDDLCNFMYLNYLFLAFLSLIGRVTLAKLDIFFDFHLNTWCCIFVRNS